MNTYPALTISHLSQLTNRELQSNYLNHLVGVASPLENRTSEVATLLAQITDPDLALRIVNLALEVDLNLGASLTSSLAPELQKIVVDEIDRLEIPTRLKINLWRETKSKAALPYLQEIFIFNHQFPNTYEGHRENEFHRDWQVTMKFLETAEKSLIQAIDNNDGFLCSSMFRLSEIGSDLAIPTLQKIIKSDDYAYYDEPEDATRSLATIGTEAAKISLIEILTDRPDLSHCIFDVFSTDGQLGIVPQLWSAHCQNYVDGGFAAISEIQEREGLYNPEFSNRSHLLFEQPKPRLRDILLGNNTA